MTDQSLPDLAAFIVWLEEVLQRDVPDDRLFQRTLAEHGFDSLDQATLLLSIDENFPGVEVEQVDGVIDPTWTIPELHHFITVALERAKDGGVPD